jgi:hypothetical protein
VTLHPQVKSLQEKLEFVDERLLSLDTSVAWLQQLVLAAVVLSLTSGAPCKPPSPLALLQVAISVALRAFVAFNRQPLFW